MNRGMVIGKFYPFHSGHAHLIKTALEQSDQLTVLVCDRSDQVFPGEVRAGWIREMFPQAEVRVMRDIFDDDNSKRWAEYTISFLGYRPDKVFTSEEYGDPYAKYMGAVHVSVDRERNTVPISATKIRKNPFLSWKFLSAPVRARLVRRIAVVGAESTGTTTLSKDLARHYETFWVPEYGRWYSEGKFFSKTEWSSEEFVFIAEEQNRLEDMFARQANRLLVCDTNSWATRLWHERYMGDMSKHVDQKAFGRRYDLVLLTGDEIPFEDDGLRDGKDIRHSMHQRFVEMLEEEKIPYILLRGSKESRLQEAIASCDELLTEGGDIFNRFPEEWKQEKCVLSV